MTQQTEIDVGGQDQAGTAVERATERVYVPSDGMDVQSLLHIALERDGAAEVIEKLVQLRNDEMDRQDARDFHAAFARFHELCPPIPRDTPGKKLAPKDGSGTVTLYFASLETIQRVVDPVLKEVGLSYSFTVPSATERSLKVECTLYHKSGHHRTSTMIVPVSKIPQAGPSQEFAGARTTGKRLTLSDVLGIATEDMDDGTGDLPVISPEQLSELRALVQAKDVDIDRVLEFAECASLAEVKAAQFGMLKRFLETRKDK